LALVFGYGALALPRRCLRERRKLGWPSTDTPPCY